MNILLIGCGNLGSILLNKWSHNAQISKVIVVQPSLSKRDAFNSITKVTFVKDYEKISRDFVPQVVVIAIKPQQIFDVMPNYGIYSKSASFISLCAGIDVNLLKKCLGNTATIIRVMPNIAMS